MLLVAELELGFERERFVPELVVGMTVDSCSWISII